MLTTQSQQNSVQSSTERLLPHTVGRFTVFYNYENHRYYHNNKFSGFLIAEAEVTFKHLSEKHTGHFTVLRLNDKINILSSSQKVHST